MRSRPIVFVALAFALAVSLLVTSPAGRASAAVIAPTPVSAPSSVIAGGLGTATATEAASVTALSSYGWSTIAAAGGYAFGIGLAVGDGALRLYNLSVPPEQEIKPLSDYAWDYLAERFPSPNSDVTVPAVFQPNGGADWNYGEISGRFGYTISMPSRTEVYTHVRCTSGESPDNTGYVFRPGVGGGGAFGIGATADDQPEIVTLNYSWDCSGKGGLGGLQVWGPYPAGQRPDITTAAPDETWAPAQAPADSPFRPAAPGPGSAGDPNRQWETEVECSGGSTVSAVSELFTESQASIPAPALPACPDGETPVGGGVTKITPGGEAPPETVIPRQGFPRADCEAGRCLLDLRRHTPFGTRSCFSDPSACAEWYSDPARQERYECTYGGLLLDLEECRVYRWTFDPLGPDYADPRTGADPTADPDARPAPAPVPAPPLDPQPQPEDPAWPEPVPAPEAGPGGDPDPQPDPAPEGKDCFGESVSMDPGTWVVGPVKCALLWAFVPESTPTNLVDLGGRIVEFQPISFVVDMGQIDVVDLGRDCPDWTVKVAGLEQNVVCESSYIAAIVQGRPVLGTLMLAAAYAPLIRSLFYAASPWKITPLP